ncbi:MAG: NAD-dependent epimerase/dehydratase [Bacteroidetes bacterium]|nr:NAD-dependent epimerase/dehydratase [Bacteroidota bacterium]
MTIAVRHSKAAPVIAIIGCGAIAESFYFPTLSASSALDNLILVDADLDRARKASSRIGAKSSSSDYREVVSKVDGVIIAVPHYLHYPISKDFLEHGVHVLCEKPLTETPDKAHDMIRLAESHNATITVNHTRRLFPSSMKVKELLAAGTIGKLKSISYFDGGEFNWPTASGFYFDSKISKKGVLLDIGAHVIDLVCWWLGGKPHLVSSFNDSFGGIEAVASVELEYQDCRCNIRLSRLSKLPNYYRIEGENGIIEGGVYDARSVSLVHPNGERKTFSSKGNEDSFARISKRLVDNFFRVIRNESTPLVSGQDVLHSIELIDEAYQRAKQFPMAWYEPREVKHVA